MALGASARAIVALVARRLIYLALVGLICGTLMAAGASKLFGARLLMVTFEAARGSRCSRCRGPAPWRRSSLLLAPPGSTP